MRCGWEVILRGAVASALAFGFTAPAEAAPVRSQPLAPPAIAFNGAIGGASAMADNEALNRIIDAVQKRYNASVVKATDITVEGRRAYELRLLSDKRVWTIRVDAETGRELPRAD